MTRLYYTKEEDDLILKHYEETGTKKLLKLLPHRTRPSITARAGILGVGSQVNKNYSEDENQIINEHYTSGGAEVVSRMIRRSPQSIHSQAHRLGIKITDELKIELRYKNFSKSYKGTENVPGTYLSRVKLGASERGLEYSVSNDYLDALILAQQFKCALSGIDIAFPPQKRGERVNYTASLDRIDSSKGYVDGNLQWVHKDVNIMKNDFDQTRFINLCGKIFAKHSQ